MSSSPISGPGQSDNLDSATKLNLMLEALAKASAELEKTVNILTDQLGRFNQELDKSLKDDVQAARERMEASLRLNLAGLSKDKESIVKALAEFKQSEIDKVILSGKTVRTALAAQVEDANRSLSAGVTGKIAGVREQLVRPDAEIKQKYDELQQALRAAVSEVQSQLVKANGAEENFFAVTRKEFESRLLQALSGGQQEFDASFIVKRTELEAEGEKVVAELAQKYDEVIGRLEHSYQDGFAAVAESRDDAAGKLKRLSDSASELVLEQDKSFQESLNGLSGLLHGLYETRLDNLAAQSRSEIVSAATQAEECLATTKAELRICLTEFQRDYVEQFEALYTRLEKTLEEFSRKKDGSAMRGLKEDRVKEQLYSLFRRLGQEMIDSAANASRSLESEFQKSMDAFEQRIETAKTQACESLTRESNLMQKELTRSFQQFDKQLAEMQAQSANLEKTGRDAANFVMTIRQANLDF